MPLSTISNPDSRHQPSPQTLSAVKEVLSDWREKHLILNEGENSQVNMDWFEYTLASRVRSWIAPQSVIAGTKDLATPFLSRSMKNIENLAELIDDLAEKLARKLVEEELLTASPRKGRNIGG